MLSKSSTSLTDNRDSCSAGVSPISSTKRWNLGQSNRLETEGTGKHLFFSYFERQGRPSLLVGLQYFGTQEGEEIPEPVMARLLCHALLHRLSDKGLPEAVETLTEMFRFYEDAPPPYRALPQATPVAAVWGESRVRPVFPVKEEE